MWRGSKQREQLRTVQTTNPTCGPAWFKHAKFQSVVSEDRKVILQRYWLVLCLDQEKQRGRGCQCRLQVECAACKPEQRFETVRSHLKATWQQ